MVVVDVVVAVFSVVVLVVVVVGAAAVPVAIVLLFNGTVSNGPCPVEYLVGLPAAFHSRIALTFPKLLKVHNISRRKKSWNIQKQPHPKQLLET